MANTGFFVEYRASDIKHKINMLGVYPVDILLTGVTGAGKSTTINALFDEELAKVGTGVDPETMELKSYELNECLRFWDTPGLGDGRQHDIEHGKKIVDLLNKTYEENQYGFIDLVVIIIEGINRDMGTTYKLINDIVLPNITSDRVLICVNQADMAQKGRHWVRNVPDAELTRFLKEMCQSIKRRVKEATGMNIKTPIYYSAEHKYHLTELLDFIIDNIPKKKRKYGDKGLV